jgi:hypothetical protein
MFCSLNSDKGKEALLALTSYISSALTNISSMPGARFDIEQFMKDMYEQVYSKSNNHDQAVDVVRMIPRITLLLAPKDATRLGSLIGKGLDLSMIGQMMVLSSNEESGVKYIEDILGVSTDPVADIESTIKEINTSQDVIDAKIQEAESKDIVEDAPAPESTGDYLRDSEGNVVVEKIEEVEEVETEDLEGKVTVVKKITERFNALADTALKDTDQEAVNDKPGEPG